uniref:winged helix-turn-helix domain-containing protein n=1 Tax=Acidocella sp. C78 TaxID=1671486 RepID=UPI00191BA1F6|nr:winged helix-turn-helix domain-containing protein [Acidocella sp. C78]
MKQTVDMYILYMEYIDIDLLSRIVEIKKINSTPVIVISNHHDSTLEISVLRLGADDYWSSVNSREIFQIRTEKFFRNSSKTPRKTQLSMPDIIQNNSGIQEKAWSNYFTPHEFMALTTLIENPGEIVTREDLSLLVRGRAPNHNSTSRDRSADNLLSRIRAKLKRLGVYRNDIKCFNGIGYAFIGDRDELVNALDARFAESNPRTPGNNAART